MEKSYTLKDIVFLLLGRVQYLIVALVLGAAAAFLYSKFVISPMYQSNVSLYVKNISTADDNVPNKDVDVNDLNVSKSLVSTYIVILNNDVVMDDLGDKLREDYSFEELKKHFVIDEDGNIKAYSLKSCFAMTAVDKTEVLSITAKTKNAELSQKLCNIMASIAPEYLTRVVGAGSVEKIGDAKLYKEKVSPSVTKNTVIGGLIALVLVIIIIFLVDFFDNTIKDTEELQNRVQKPLLGEISHIGGKTKKKEIGKSSDRKTKLLFNNSNIPFNVVENYKSMRTNIAFSLSTAENKILAVTSSLPSEGKSITIANLVVTMAEAEKKVLLIDADMRKPVQHKNFGLHNKKGLSTVLSRESVFEECVNRNVRKNLDILTSGVIPPNPSELLASKKMREMIAKIRNEYDYILIDTPPILQMTDVLGLADIIFGVAVVVAFGKTSYYEIKETQKKLELGNCNLVGVILNDIAVGTGGGYGYKYGGYHYSYRYGYKYKYYAQNYKYEQAKENSEEENSAAITDKQNKSAKTDDRKRKD